jgi:hypothetical protein
MKVKVKGGNGAYNVPAGTPLGDLTDDQIRRRKPVLKKKSTGIYVTTAPTQFKEGETFGYLGKVTPQGAVASKYDSQFLEVVNDKKPAAPKAPTT